MVFFSMGTIVAAEKKRIAGFLKEENLAKDYLVVLNIIIFLINNLLSILEI